MLRPPIGSPVICSTRPQPPSCMTRACPHQFWSSSITAAFRWPISIARWIPASSAMGGATLPHSSGHDDNEWGSLRSSCLGRRSPECQQSVGTHLPRRQGMRVYEHARRCQRLHPPLAPNPSKPHGIIAQVRVMPQVLPFRLREVQVPSTPPKPLRRNPEGFRLSGPCSDSTRHRLSQQLSQFACPGRRNAASRST